ncbi:ribosomal protein S18-alanine N-acetyltransferase [Pengzhenrongella sp.]|jgi:ribosomal-protein-alanine N-acetyltransferase|uniref:ribosomal protein S18-alanine N-acetyltransferase n=1 Tax=Pengzhenrongella sp. TaxID=2888820 RepID=UPI002F9481CB
MTASPTGPAGSNVPVVVRPLLTGDLPTVVRLERELFGASAWSAAMLADELDGPGRWYVAAELPAGSEPAGPGRSAAVGPVGAPAAAPAAAPENPLAGYAGVWFDGDDAHVMTIGVARTYRGRGIGGELLAALVGRARDLGARALLLEVRVDNEPAIALYERFGFERVGRRRRYYQPENIDAWTMQCVLSKGTS